MQELAFVRTVLSDSGDAKNYHAWGHRQWVLRTFGGWEAELAYVEELLQQDLRNNSAWNQRFYVLQSSQDLKQLDVVRGEVAYALRCATHPRPNPPPTPQSTPWSTPIRLCAHALLTIHVSVHGVGMDARKYVV